MGARMEPWGAPAEVQSGLDVQRQSHPAEELKRHKKHNSYCKNSNHMI